VSPKVSRPRFVAYYRVSTDKQGRSGLGIEAQRETVRRFIATEGGGWPPLALFTEHESGRRSDRPQLAKAVAACRAHRAVLVVAKVDRLTRSAAFLDGLARSGVDVRFCDLPEVKGATGRFLLAQMAAVAELEAGLISERTKAALAAKVARDGQWDRNASHHLVPGAGQQAAAQAVSDRAQQRSQDLAPVLEELRRAGASSLRDLAMALNERDVPTPRGGAWGPSAVRNVLARIEAGAAT
jgi:DNA invertase Pin-like site-specific DNA recombinase